MQLIKPSPIAVATLATLLSACGGGKSDDPAPPPAIKVSAIALSKATPLAIAENELQFEGGVCSGGRGDLTASWDFGDKTPESTSNTHTYTTGDASYTVKVTCTDATGNKAEGKNVFTVAHASMNGFLGKKWSTYTKIPALHPSVYPVAGLSTAGDINGVGVPSTASGLDVAAMSANFGISNDIGYDKLPTGTDRPPFNDTQEGMRTASIDLAVSPNGRVMAAWMAGTSVWYATKNGLKGTWSVPVKLDVPVLDEAIKVVVNDAGAGAIAYCTRTGAQVVTYASQATQAPVTISKRCGGVDSEEKSLQRYRAFDIAIDNTTSTVYAVGVNDATAGKSAVTVKSYTPGSGWTAATAVSDELTTPPDSLSYARSPNGNFAVVAWDQLGTVAPFTSNVFSRIQAGASWGAIRPVQSHFITKDYSRPLVAVNDKGDAFLAMRLSQLNSNTGAVVSQIEVSNYAASATAPAWSQPYQLRKNGLAVPFSATDIAVDKWGTGLLTRTDGGGDPVQAGTFSKAAIWSGFADLSPRFPNPKAFHYQTMRALPDGRAILVTSVYDDKTPLTDSTAPISSGYVLLK